MDATIIIGAFILAGVLIILELFIPSNGLLSAAAAASLIFGIVKCFMVNEWLGLLVTLATVVALPFFILALVRIWPDTWIGRRIAINRAKQTEPGQSIPDANKLEKLMGQTGQALTDLRPVGAVMFGSERVDCVSQTGQIEKGSTVAVVRVEGVRVVVREQQS